MVTVVILTYNEEIHIGRAIANVRDWAHAVFVVDSHSMDRTREIALKAGAQVFCHEFVDYSSQREWALRALPYETEWVLFLDADELVSEDLKREITEALKAAPPGVNGFYIKRRFYWDGKWLRHGGLYPTWILRLVRHEFARCDPRTVNEHLTVEGETRYLEHDLLHVDLKPISDWIAKHNRYSSLEALEQIRSMRNESSDTIASLWGTQAQRKRWIREKIWNPLLPPLVRPFLYFFYVYVVRLGFLDGLPGFSYHVLHGFAYRMMIEIKYLLLKARGSEAINPTGTAYGDRSPEVKTPMGIAKVSQP